MILDDIGLHVELNNKPQGEPDPKPLYPATTKDDIYMTDNGNILTEFIPTDVPSSAQADTSTGAPIFCNSNETIAVVDTVANLLLNIQS